MALTCKRLQPGRNFLTSVIQQLHKIFGYITILVIKEWSSKAYNKTVKKMISLKSVFSLHIKAHRL